MIELTIGSRFWYKGKLYEVKENKFHECNCCDFDKFDNKCRKMKCHTIQRHDGKFVYFSEVTDE